MNAIRLIAVTAAVLMAATTAYAGKKYTIGDGGSLAWNRMVGDACGCPFSGGNCKITNTLIRIDVRDNGNTWSVSGALEEANADIVLDDGSNYFQPFQVGGYTFASGYFVVDEGEFPGVPGGTHINLVGVTTDAAGNFDAVVPK